MRPVKEKGRGDFTVKLLMAVSLTVFISGRLS